MNRDVGPAGEGDDGLSAVADEPVGGRDDAVEHRRDRGAVDIRQHGVDGRALAVAGDEDGNVFEEKTRVLRPPPRSRGWRGKIGASALERLIGIGGRLAAPPLLHHRAYGSVPRRFDRVRLGRAHGFGEDRATRNSGCAAPVGPTGVLTFARGPWASHLQATEHARHTTKPLAR